MTAAIVYDPRPADDRRPLGIDVASDEFVRAFARYATQDTLYTVSRDGVAGPEFRALVSEAGADPARCVGLDRDDADGLALAGCVLRYDPGINDQLWLRRRHGQRRYSVAGFTHASSTAAVMEAVGAYAVTPCQSWDALICASTSIKSALETLLQGWRDYLGERVGAPVPCPIQMPVIPLGVNGHKLAQRATPDKRAAARRVLDLADDTVAVLYVGRLNHVAKANPMPLLLAAEAAAQETKKPVQVLFHGYFPDSALEDAFREGVLTLTAAAGVTFIEHGDPALPDGAWAAADIFCSPVDNIQESFGLTPVEAMAAGLPVVVSDWDGYRDTVRDGIEGFAVPTVMPAAGAGGDLAHHYFAKPGHYGDFVGGTAQSTAVDTQALTRALVQLIDDPELRRRMGEAGRSRVAEVFDWKQVIPAYEALFQELAARRQTDAEIAPVRPDGDYHPLRPDPFRMFAGFATASISDDGRLQLTDLDWETSFARIGLKIGLIDAAALIDLEDIPQLVGQIEANSGITVGELVDSLADSLANPLSHADGAALRRTIGWLVKLGICRYRT